MRIQCKKCGKVKKYHAFGLCTSCYGKEYRKKNVAKEQLRKKQWAEANPEKIQLANKRWRTKNGIGITGRKNKKRNFRTKTEYQVQWRKENRDYIKFYNKQYRQTHPEVFREARIRRRANGRTKKGTISKLLNENIFKYGILTCEKCKRDCEDNYHIYHIVPISLNGISEKENLQILCSSCNLTKHIQIINYKDESSVQQLYLH